jgi:hypothetical protein
VFNLLLLPLAQRILKEMIAFSYKLEKQGTLLALACFESNIVDVPYDTWWLDLGATIHVVNSLPGFTAQV